MANVNNTLKFHCNFCYIFQQTPLCTFGTLFLERGSDFNSFILELTVLASTFCKRKRNADTKSEKKMQYAQCTKVLNIKKKLLNLREYFEKNFKTKSSTNRDANIFLLRPIYRNKTEGFRGLMPMSIYTGFSFDLAKHKPHDLPFTGNKQEHRKRDC